MITRTYISKFNTIIENSYINTGINPISELSYGNTISRMLVYFDHEKIKKMVDDKIYPDISKLKHRLMITNSGSLDFTTLHCGVPSNVSLGTKIRATSFTLVFFLIDREWDNGKGFNYTENFLNKGYNLPCLQDNSDLSKLVSTDASNWYNAKNGSPWGCEGVYSNDSIQRAYNEFISNGKEINYNNIEEGLPTIIGYQNFDIGNENINIDITEIVNKFIIGDLENYGIGVAFAPNLENTKISNIDNYVAFFTPHTNTFFEPYVETDYDDFIDDDRSNFALDKINRLYLYVNMGGEPTNLDEMPVCTITDNNDEPILVFDNNVSETIETVEENNNEPSENEEVIDNEPSENEDEIIDEPSETEEENEVTETNMVKQFSKGIYYVEFTLDSSDYSPNTMFYDVWSNIKYKGKTLNNVTLEFVTKSQDTWFNIGNSLTQRHHLVPSVYGIKNSEDIKRGDVRKVVILAREEYSKKEAELVNSMEARLYIKDGSREVDVLPFFKVNKSFLENFILIDTNILIPERYYLDVKMNYGLESIIHHNVLSFNITDDLNNKYR